MNDLKLRIIHSFLRIDYCYGYAFLDEFGLKSDCIIEFMKEMNSAIGNVCNFSKYESAPYPEDIVEDRLRKVDINILEQWEEKVDALVDELQSYPPYVKALTAIIITIKKH